MSSLKTLDRQPFETLLEMGGGYVLDLTNQSFASLIAETVNKDVYADRYTKYGDSKAKRLRAFWDLESDTVVGKVLAEFLDLWEYKHPQPTAEQTTLLKRCRAIVGRLLGEPASVDTTERDFLRREFKDISMAKVPIESNLIPILEARFNEATSCLEGKAPLAAIFMCGSILEGLLLGTALSNPKQFNQARSSPKDASGKVKAFQNWSLAQLIDVACDLGYLKLDIKKFSHALRDFRNYIHPYQQMSSNFSPDKHTAEICLQVLRAAIASLSGQRRP